MEMFIKKLIKNLEKRWFANNDQEYYNNDMRNALLDNRWVYDECVEDIMNFFETTFMGDSFDSNMIIADFKKYQNLDNYANFIDNRDSIMEIVKELGHAYN